jgi:trehalose 6-phosphate synthase/phosphatase
VPSPDPSWAAYKQVNEIFANRVAQVYRPGDLIMVHDYHLLLVPKLIREALGQAPLQSSHNGITPSAGLVSSPSITSDKLKGMDWETGSVSSNHERGRGAGSASLLSAALGSHLQLNDANNGDLMIGLFVHTPWPSSEIFRCLPQRRDILEGMLGANLILFQTYSYSRHFVSSCIRVCGFESTTTGVDVNGQNIVVSYCPIGIDIERVAQDRDQPNVRPKMDALRALYHDKKIIVGREKLDAPKGVYNKLQAFEKFLQVYPEWRGKVVLIQVTTPALSESPKLEREVAELVSQINSTFGSLDFTPVHH